jgi:hypothetical protein
MSGGHFDYNQHRILDIIDNIEHVLKNKRKYDKEWDMIENDYTEETFSEFEKAIEVLELAHIYAHRIDYLLSGDDGEESFHNRLSEDLKKMSGV